MTQNPKTQLKHTIYLPELNSTIQIFILNSTIQPPSIVLSHHFK